MQHTATLYIGYQN